MSSMLFESCKEKLLAGGEFAKVVSKPLHLKALSLREGL